MLVAVKAVAAASLAAGARVLPVALTLHSMAGVASRAQEHRAGGVLPNQFSIYAYSERCVLWTARNSGAIRGQRREWG